MWPPFLRDLVSSWQLQLQLQLLLRLRLQLQLLALLLLRLRLVLRVLPRLLRIIAVRRSLVA